MHQQKGHVMLRPMQELVRGSLALRNHTEAKYVPRRPESLAWRVVFALHLGIPCSYEAEAVQPHRPILGTDSLKLWGLVVKWPGS